MNSRKFSGLILAVFTSIVLAAVILILADGWPIPPFPPGQSTLVADGWPIPPFPPAQSTLVADGWPLPPGPPNPPAIQFRG
jgi:hypothetical protein